MSILHTDAYTEPVDGLRLLAHPGLLEFDVLGTEFALDCAEVEVLRAALAEALTLM
ncbi:hypothetical protein RBB84_02495 [Rhodococcus sp. D-6]|uniref:Uncharacterized protein n=1 Tax=Rhodococcus sp. D-6 TaxID=1387842 RepID=A0AAU7UYH7_9NOCA|nr:hypothetical protein [Rhodococcus sp. HS-D2]